MTLRIQPITTVAVGPSGRIERAVTADELWAMGYTPPQGTSGLISLMGRCCFDPESTLWMPNKTRRPEQVSPEIRQQVQRVLAGEAPWPLFLTGTAGSGKTCLGLLLADLFGGPYTTFPDLVIDVQDAMYGRSTYSSGHPRSYRELWNDWAKPVLPVLDEIGTRSNVSEHKYDALKRCLDIRENKPAVYISNHGLDTLTKLYDDRITSRLSAGTVVMLTGDRRGQLH